MRKFHNTHYQTQIKQSFLILNSLKNVLIVEFTISDMFHESEKETYIFFNTVGIEYGFLANPVNNITCYKSDIHKLHLYH